MFHWKTVTVLFLLWVSTQLAGCGNDFAPYNVLDNLRVLAIQADPPELSPGAQTSLQALVYNPSDQEVSYRWSWCPFTKARESGYACAVDEQSIAAINAPTKVAAGLNALPSFLLGQESTAQFFYNVDPEALQAVCGNLLAGGLPPLAEVPTCEESLEITVRLEVSAGDQRVIAIKRMQLLFDQDLQPNRNPALGTVTIGEEQSAPSSDMLLAPNQPLAVQAGTTYRLRLQVPQASSEELLPGALALPNDDGLQRERLTLSWFVTQGETDVTRTSFIDGDVAFESLLENLWEVPEIQAENQDARLFFVLRDGRGGVTWSERQVRIEG